MSDERQYIAPYHEDGRHGWLVKVYWYPDTSPGVRIAATGRRPKKWHSKLFRFSDYPTEDDALVAARAYRDKWFAENANTRVLNRPRGQSFFEKLPKNNTTGILGVSRSEKQVSPRYRDIRWQVTYPHPTEKRRPIHKTFCVHDRGEVEALKLAVECRRTGMLEALTARNVPMEHGAYDIIAFYDDILENLDDLRDQSNATSIIEIIKDGAIPPTTKRRQIEARVAQQRFRREVLEFFDFRCAVTGTDLLVRASHIKPWRVANDQERIDPANGLALSPVYDAAFDAGLITFRPDGGILVRSEMLESLATLGISGQERIRVLTDEHFGYLDWHRKHIFAQCRLANNRLQPADRVGPNVKPFWPPPVES